MQYRIFPPIGIARLGEDGNFILGPEVPEETVAGGVERSALNSSRG